MVRTVGAAFPPLNAWLNALPDPRFQPMCLYTAAHLWWQILGTFLSRSGSRNAFDEHRQSGQAAWNLGELCGQRAEDPRFAGQPTTWQETLRLLPLHRANHLRHRLGHNGQEGTQDFRWVEHVMLGQHQTNVLLSGEITAHAATLYAYITNFSQLSPERVAILVNGVGRERHLIEDTFNTQKNNGIGLEHVFCARATASKNYYTMMQVAQILWILTCRGCLQRLYDWARRATEQGLARAVWEGLRAVRLPPDLPPLGQIRFSSA